VAARRTTTTAGNRSHDVTASAGLVTTYEAASPMARGAFKAGTTARRFR
jgi:hypothetical protein